MQYYFLIAGNAIMILIFGLKFNKLPPQIPLFYSAPWGKNQLAELWMIAFLPIIVNGLFFINIWIKKRFFAENDFIKKATEYVNIFLIICITLIFIKIILLVS